MSQPAYHLRPNKAVDRNLFCETLIRLSRIINISQYRYIGFGSYEFDEFKLFYRKLGIEDMHSIEMDSNVYARQIFNKPYAGINLFNKSCSKYFDEDYEETKQSIIWLDFSSAIDKLSQCQDIANVSSKLGEWDILRVTLNAQPSSIKVSTADDQELVKEQKRKERFLSLKNRLGEFFPTDAKEEDIETGKYPSLLLRIIKKAIYSDMDETLAPIPICAYSYNDGQQMMTATFVIGAANREKKDEQINRLSKEFDGWKEYSNLCSWNDVIKIELPALTVHEQLELGQCKRDDDSIKVNAKKLGIRTEEIEKYYKFVRYYPNYQQVVI